MDPAVGAAHIESVRTPAKEDKHLAMTLLFVAIVCINHKLNLALTLGELGILGASMGIYIGQSQLAAWAKLREVLTPRVGESAYVPVPGPSTPAVPDGK